MYIFVDSAIKSVGKLSKELRQIFFCCDYKMKSDFMLTKIENGQKEHSKSKLSFIFEFGDIINM